MPRRGGEIEINNFGGGLHTTAAITEVKFNEGYDVSNVIIGPHGVYVRTRYCNTTFNSSAMSSGANVQGLGYFKPISGSDHLVAVCGAKLFESTSLDGTMNDITGALTITSGQNNLWTLLTFNNIHIGFGGSATAPNAPFQYTGAGNAAALTGTPPSAYGAIQANNRVFAFRTAAAPSIVQWCILGSAQDWTGTGSGSQNIATSDNDSITAMAVMDNNLALVFKQNSIHRLLIGNLVSGAFPTFSLFKNVGCAGKHAVVVADGLCYFITPQGRMKITDGEQIIEDLQLPQLSYIDNLWNAMNSTRYEFIQGIRMVGEDYDHIVWLMTSTASGTTHDTAIIWDKKNKCWLRHKSGWKGNCLVVHPTGVVYMGNYAGKIFKQDVSTATTDASEAGANPDSYWSSGWTKFGSLQKIKGVQEAYLSFVSQTLGNLEFSWGYDFNLNNKSQIIDQRVNGGIIGVFVIGVGLIGGQSDFVRRIFTTGNGKVFQYRFRNSDYRMKVNSLNLLGRKVTGAV